MTERIPKIDKGRIDAAQAHAESQYTRAATDKYLARVGRRKGKIFIRARSCWAKMNLWRHL